MDFKLTEEQLMIQQAARDFAKMELLPGVIERDEHSKFPTEQVKKMAELGFMGMMVDPKYGGSGLDSISYILAITEISKVFEIDPMDLISFDDNLVLGSSFGKSRSLILVSTRPGEIAYA